jgi:DNA-binding response OmpR family regulator
MFAILVVEDDVNLGRTLCTFLDRNGYCAVYCKSAQDAYDAMYKQMFDLIISDIMMPDIDGYEFAETVRTLDKNVPIIFMTARDDLGSMQRGYSTGADDYVVKPVDFNALLLRIGALLRRAGIAAQRKLVLGNFTIDLDERTAYLDENEISLTAREFNILYKLLSYPKKTFTRTQLMDEFWDVDTASGPRTVDVYMTKLRAKLSECTSFEIVTVHGLGYKAVIK